jgi:hypothetical protein
MSIFVPDTKPKGRNEMAAYLAKHEGYAPNNKEVTFSHNIKLHRLIRHIPLDHQDAAYTVIQSPFWYDALQEHFDEFHRESGGYRMTTEGRSGGHICLLDSRYNGLSMSVDDLRNEAPEKLDTILWCEWDAWKREEEVAERGANRIAEAASRNFDSRTLQEVKKIIEKGAEHSDQFILNTLQSELVRWEHRRRVKSKEGSAAILDEYHRQHPEPKKPNPFLAMSNKWLRDMTDLVFLFDTYTEAIWEDFKYQCEVESELQNES